jgi:hypothetical protein
MILIQWDSMRDAHEFSAAYKNYGDLRFGEADLSTRSSAEWTMGDISGLLERQSNQTLIILTSSPTDLHALRDAVTLPVHALP